MPNCHVEGIEQSYYSLDRYQQVCQRCGGGLMFIDPLFEGRCMGLNHAVRSIANSGVPLVTSVECNSSIFLALVYNLAALINALHSRRNKGRASQSPKHERDVASPITHLLVQKWHLWHCRGIHQQLTKSCMCSNFMQVD
jgi:hypothetical protein